MHTALSPTSEPVPEDAGGLDRRSARIADYLAQALAEDNPLLANLGTVNCDLLQVQNFLRQAVEDAFAKVPRDLSEWEHLTPAIDQLVKIVKQIDRFTQLDIRIRSEEQSARREEARLMNEGQ